MGLRKQVASEVPWEGFGGVCALPEGCDRLWRVQRGGGCLGKMGRWVWGLRKGAGGRSGVRGALEGGSGFAPATALTGSWWVEETPESSGTPGQV